MSLRTLTICAVAASALTLAACGTDPGDRAVSGGLLGAGAGAGVAAVTGGNVGTGALIGGAAGAVVGAVSDPCKLNLGDPYWRRHGEDEYYRRCGHR